MIRNPGGAAEKKYKITVTDGLYNPGPVQEEAKAGEFVNTHMAEAIKIITASGLRVPRDDRNSVGLPATTRVADSPHCFVMPAEDVTISSAYS